MNTNKNKSRQYLDQKAMILNKCWENGIKVVQKPINRGFLSKGYPVKLNLEIHGKIAKLGEMVFKQNSIELNQKIFEIYESYYYRLT